MKKAGQRKAKRARPTVAQVRELERKLRDAENRRQMIERQVTSARRHAEGQEAKAIELGRQLDKAVADNQGMRRELEDWRVRGADLARVPSLERELAASVDQLGGVKQRALGLAKQLGEWFSSDGPLVSNADAIGHDVGIVMHRLAGLVGEPAKLEGAVAGAYDRFRTKESPHSVPARAQLASRAIDHEAAPRRLDAIERQVREIERRFNNLCTVGTPDGRVPTLTPAGSPV